MSTEQTNSAIGEKNPQDFHRPFDVNNIPENKFQHWPYSPYVTARWGDYIFTSTGTVKAATKPAVLVEDHSFDLNGEFREGQSYLENLLATHTKGFAILQGDKLLCEFYHNGFQLTQANLLQSASKTFLGVIIHRLIEADLIALDTKVGHYVPELAGSVVGDASVQQALDMCSGAEALDDYHTPGSNGQVWELEIGLQKGDSQGHLNAIKNSVKTAEPGTLWQYTDQNTDALAIAAERVSGKSFAELLSELANDIGAQHSGLISLSTDGTPCPSYGICVSLRSYALFHRWLAEKKAPQSYYDSVQDTQKDMMAPTFLGEVFADMGFKTIYGSQSYFMPEENIIFSFGSFGQLGFSDLETGTTVVNQQDWGFNVELSKLTDTLTRSVKLIKQLRAAKA